MPSLPPPWISDPDLLRLVMRITGWPQARIDLRAWRRAIERERARIARRRLGLPPLPPQDRAALAASSVLLDLLASPEAQAVIALLWAGHSPVAKLLDTQAQALYDGMLRERVLDRDIRANIEGLRQYADEKAAPHGRALHSGLDPAYALPSNAVAALNAMTPEALAEWRDRLSAARRAPATRPHLLRRLRAEGTAACRAYPELDLCRPAPGPSRSIWPLPQPPLPSEGDGEPESPNAPLRRP